MRCPQVSARRSRREAGRPCHRMNVPCLEVKPPKMGEKIEDVDMALLTRVYEKLTITDTDVAEAMPEELRAKARYYAHAVVAGQPARRTHLFLRDDRQLRLLEDSLRSGIVENHRADARRYMRLGDQSG